MSTIESTSESANQPVNKSIIEQSFQKSKQEKKGAFIPYFIAGYPDLERCYEILCELSHYSDVIELGIPFSDPLADGTTIQRGMNQVLDLGIRLEEIFDLSLELTRKISKPLVYMVYFNQVFSYGIENFLRKMKEMKISGIIVPDLLPDSEPDFNRMTRDYGIDSIFLMTPVTQENRISLILKESRGFLYFVSVTGVTGERSSLSGQLSQMVQNLKKRTELPIAVGFGISKAEQVSEVLDYADGVIVGSALVQKITDHQHSPHLVSKVLELVRELSLTETDHSSVVL